MKKKFYVTTAIDYVNAKPHIGHAFEKVLADALARYERQKGKDVFFLTGVDENAQKNVQAAEEAGVDVKKFVDKNTAYFKELADKLNVGYSKFIRTSAGEHAKVVNNFLKKIIQKGDIYKGKYEGYYCSGCEAFITEKDLSYGKCPEHDRKPEFRKEDAYFFRLSKYKNKLAKFIENYVIPDSRKKEILKRVNEGLNDLCISRKGVDWGIDFPGDKDYKVYVWVDALINYISGAEKKWPADVHVIGKGINWFHSVIWPALLMSAGYELPKKLLVHGYLISGGKKMSKSLGNTVDPLELLKKYDADSVRYSLLRCSVFDDSDYSEELLIQRHNNELANKLGNLVSRVAGLIEKVGVGKTGHKIQLSDERKKLLREGKLEIEKMGENYVLKRKDRKTLEIKRGEEFPLSFSTPLEFLEGVTIFFEEQMENYEFDKALNTLFTFIDFCNWYTQERKIWETKDKKDLYELKEAILKIADLLEPFIPLSAEKIKKQFSAAKIKKGEILFRKI